MQRRHFVLQAAALILLAAMGPFSLGHAGAEARVAAAPACVPQPTSKSSLVYALADHRQIYYSKGGGGPWKPVSSGLPAGMGVYAVGLDAVSSDVLYAGTTGQGIFKTFNGGAHWFSANDESIATTYVYAMAVNVHDNSYVYAAGDNAVYRSTNGGVTWEQGNIGLPSFLVYAMALDVKDPNVVYVGTDDAGVYRSDANFEHWTSVSSGLPAESAVRTLTTDPAQPGVLYAGTDVGLFRTNNHGASWQPVGDLPSGKPVLAVALTPGNSRILFAGTAQGLYRSADGGTHWTAAGGQMGSAPISALAVDPANPQNIYAAARGAIWRSTNGEASSSIVNAGMNAASLSLLAVFHASLTPASPCQAPSGHGSWQYAAQTGHTIAEPFLSFYKAHGGQVIFGLPRTEAIVQDGLTVQWFENSELQLVRGRVRIVAIGDAFTKGRVFNSNPASAGTPQHPLFRLGTHNVSDIFLRFWKKHGGAAVLGMPISEEIHEQNNDGTGTLYQVQFFNNCRLEYHPELHGDAVVQLGKLGDSSLRRIGWI